MLIPVLLSGIVFAPQTDAADADALAKAVQNPLASMVTLPLQANYNGGVGPDDRTFFNLNVQPVVPFLGKEWNIIARTIIPVNSVPQGPTDSEFGLGDTSTNYEYCCRKSCIGHSRQELENRTPDQARARYPGTAGTATAEQGDCSPPVGFTGNRENPSETPVSKTRCQQSTRSLGQSRTNPGVDSPQQPQRDCRYRVNVIYLISPPFRVMQIFVKT